MLDNTLLRNVGSMMFLSHFAIIGSIQFFIKIAKYILARQGNKIYLQYTFEIDY